MNVSENGFAPGDRIRFERPDDKVVEDTIRGFDTVDHLLEPYARNTRERVVVLTEHSWTTFGSIQCKIESKEMSMVKCHFCDAAATRAMPQSTDQGRSVEWVACCDAHATGWWEAADWDGRALEFGLHNDNDALLSVLKDCAEVLRYAKHVVEQNGLHRETEYATGWPTLWERMNKSLASLQQQQEGGS